MVAAYPSSVKSFTSKVDLVDTIYADHVNTLQDEVRAVESSLGTSILTSSYSGSFTQTSSWANLGARLTNIERGLISGVPGGPYFSKSGDTVTAGVGQVGLTVKPASGATSNLIEARTSANALGFRVDYLGLPFVGSNAVLYVGSAAYNSIITTITTPITFPDAIHPFMLAGM